MSSVISASCPSALGDSSDAATDPARDPRIFLQVERSEAPADHALEHSVHLPRNLYEIYMTGLCAAYINGSLEMADIQDSPS